jgi:transposase
MLQKRRSAAMEATMFTGWI